MPRQAKIVLIIFGVLLVIGLMVPYVVDVDRYRPQIIAQVESRTGRKIEIGKIWARIIPTAGFSIENVTLGPPAGFAAVNLLTVDSIKGSVSLFALLRGAAQKAASAQGAGSSSFTLDSVSVKDAELSLVDVRGRLRSLHIRKISVPSG